MSIWLRNGKIVSARGKTAIIDCPECPCAGRCVTSYMHFAIVIGSDRQWYPVYCVADVAYSNASGVIGTPVADNFIGGIPSDFQLSVGTPQGNTVPMHIEFTLGHAPFAENPYTDFELHSVLIPTTSARPSLWFTNVSFSPHYSWADELYSVDYEEDCNDPFI